jgi:hypothetical protein
MRNPHLPQNRKLAGTGLLQDGQLRIPAAGAGPEGSRVETATGLDGLEGSRGEVPELRGTTGAAVGAARFGLMLPAAMRGGGSRSSTLRDGAGAAGGGAITGAAVGAGAALSISAPHPKQNL